MQLLSKHPQGLSEYQLLKRLRRAPYELLPALELDDHLGLFQCHFLIYHTLYRLRDRLHAEQRASLQISALLIALRGYQSGEAMLCEPDPLRGYYLDLHNLDVTGEDEVAELLREFWRRLQRRDDAAIASALELLGLEDADDFSTVKQQYRRQVMRHHPDRGGEAAKMQRLNEALELLRHHYNR